MQHQWKHDDVGWQCGNCKLTVPDRIEFSPEGLQQVPADPKVLPTTWCLG